MEKTLEYYKSCIKRLLSAYESLHTERSQIELLFDDERMRYMAARRLGKPKEALSLFGAY